jgi:predicted RNA-binding Zn ribbon-like protein
VETPEHVLQVAIVGGNVALDFANTGGPGHGTEALHAYPDLVAWALHAGAVGGPDASRLTRKARLHPDRADEVFRHAIRLRDAVGSAFGAIASDEAPDPASLDVLRRAASDALDHARLVRTGGSYAWTWAADDDLAKPTWLVAHAASELLTQGPLDRIKRCGGCPYLFLDESRNRSRRWCSMDDCGTQAKMRRFVANRRARTRAS